jgi:hypothetical protein
MRSPTFPLLALLAATSVAHALPIGQSVTISDANFSGVNSAGNWYADREDNETETNPNTANAQVWDLEGMFLSGSQLTMVGGFDFQNGTAHGARTYKSGDIFFDINGDAVYGQAANGGSGVSAFGSLTTSSNSYGYDYVLDFNAAMTSYSVYSLTAASQVLKVTDVPSSNPWRYVSGGTLLQGYSNVAIGGYGLLGDVSTLTSFNSLSLGLKGDGTNNNHYFISVDLSFLPVGTATLAHYTMECGNDNLVGGFSVPESGMGWVLVGASLAGLLAMRRRLAGR